MRIYLVKTGYGEYEEYHEKVLKAFTSEIRATQYMFDYNITQLHTKRDARIKELKGEEHYYHYRDIRDAWIEEIEIDKEE